MLSSSFIHVFLHGDVIYTCLLISMHTYVYILCIHIYREREAERGVVDAR